MRDRGPIVIPSHPCDSNRRVNRIPVPYLLITNLSPERTTYCSSSSSSWLAGSLNFVTFSVQSFSGNHVELLSPVALQRTLNFTTETLFPHKRICVAVALASFFSETLSSKPLETLPLALGSIFSRKYERWSHFVNSERCSAAGEAPI